MNEFVDVEMKNKLKNPAKPRKPISQMQCSNVAAIAAAAATTTTTTTDIDGEKEEKI